jgi:hypothetical protein
MLAHGGGGHEAAGTCQIANDQAEVVLAELVQTLADGERAAISVQGRVVGAPEAEPSARASTWMVPSAT